MYIDSNYPRIGSYEKTLETSVVRPYVLQQTYLGQVCVSKVHQL